VIEQVDDWNDPMPSSRWGLREKALLLAWIDEQAPDIKAGLKPASVLIVHVPAGRGRIGLEFDPASGFRLRWPTSHQPAIWSWQTSRDTMLEGTLDRRTGRAIMAPAQVAQLRMHDYVVLQAMVARYLELAR